MPETDAREQTVLDHPLTETQAALASSKPLKSLRLPLNVIRSLREKGFSTLHDLATAPLSAAALSPIRLRRVRLALLAAMAGEYPLDRLQSCSLAELPEHVRDLLGRIEERRRSLLERRNGLWDGRKLALSPAAKAAGIAPPMAERELDAAIADVRKLLRPDSDAFRAAMRALYLRVLAGKQGMAGVHEWEDQGSALYEGQIEACLAFAFLCHVGQVQPEQLVSIGLDGACYDSVTVKYRHDQAVEVMKTALLNIGRPIPPEEMRDWLKNENRIEVSPEYLKRCVEVSRELGFEKSGMIGLKSWPYFDAHSLHDMACAALTAVGKAVHYDRIGSEIERLYPWRAPVNRLSLQHILHIHKDQFMLARHGGVFGLAEWHLNAAASLKDFLVDFLRENGGRAKRRELVEAARERHGYKPASVQMALSASKELFRRTGWGVWELAV
jgi:hypothetical protein